jgi:Domain of unknown function (DUF1835)/Protein of unknown function
MIHLVFQRSDIDVLKQAIDLDPSLQGEVIQIADDFAVGPIQQLDTPEGRENRRAWWAEVLQGGDYQHLLEDPSHPDDHQTVVVLLRRLQDNPLEMVWIWAAQNGHDVSGYYWVISQLKHFAGRIYILYLNNLPFINPKGHIFYPTNLFEIPAKEFLKAKKLARLVTPSEFEVDPDEWQKLAQEDKGVRVLEGGRKLSQYDYDYFDRQLSGFITTDWQRASKVIHHFLAKSSPTTGDAYLLWRLKHIVELGQAEAQGELKHMKDFEIKARVPAPLSDALSS